MSPDAAMAIVSATAAPDVASRVAVAAWATSSATERFEVEETLVVEDSATTEVADRFEVAEIEAVVPWIRLRSRTSEVALIEPAAAWAMVSATVSDEVAETLPAAAPASVGVVPNELVAERLLATACATVGVPESAEAAEVAPEPGSWPCLLPVALSDEVAAIDPLADSP